MGTTATVCALSGNALFVAQVGDSRAYLLRGGRLTQLTRDQTLAELMLEQGQLTPGRTLEEAASPVEAAEALIALANAAGGPDNVTAIVARIEGEALDVADDPVVPQKGYGLAPVGSPSALAEDPPAFAAGVAAPASSPRADEPAPPASDRRSALGRVIAFLRGALRPGSGR